MQNKLLALIEKMHLAGSYIHAEELLHLFIKEYSLNYDAMVLLSQNYRHQGRSDMAKQQAQTCLLIPDLNDEQKKTLMEFIYEDATLSENKISPTPTGDTPSSDIEDIVRKAVIEALEIQARAPLYLRDPGHEYLLANRSNKALEFDDQVFAEAKAYATWQEHMQVSLAEIEIAGLYLEFGVHQGLSINEIARFKPEKTIYGFDSFEGFPESWHSFPAGTMTLNGVPPETRPNVQIHKGWFEDTIPVFLKAHSENAAFLHIDCDLYSSTETVFQEFEPRIKAGTVIVFDDYLPDEITAFKDFVEQHPMKYR
jgi:hypothetical protein